MDVFFDQQAQVRRTKKHGTWSLLVEPAPDDEVFLRRWPLEAEAPLAKGMPAYRGGDGKFPAGKAFPVASAELKIGAGHRQKPVASDDTVVTFPVTLPRGPVSLPTWFRDDAGREIAGAYDVSVRALRPGH